MQSILTVLLLNIVVNLHFLVESTFDLKIHNTDVLRNGLAGENIFLELLFEENFVSLNETKTANLCFLVNGAICHCFDQPYVSLQPQLPLLCVLDNESSFWFSVSVILPLRDNEIRVVKSLPVYIDKPNKETTTTPTNGHTTTLTLVLPLTIDDLSRSAILFHSLHHIPIHTVHEMLIFVPDWQHSAISPAIQGMTAHCNFAVTVHPESVLFSRPMNESNAYPYALQMGIKLLAAKMITTPFYMTLDADVVLLQPFQVSDLIEVSPRDGISRAVYDNEDREVHAQWWEGSKTFLNFSSSNSYNHYNLKSSQGGFGVTPAILSTYGSLLVIDQIYNSYEYDLSERQHTPETATVTTIQQTEDSVILTNTAILIESDNKAHKESLWLDGFGRGGMLWSEYTLYRLVLDHFEVFEGLHVDQSTLTTVGTKRHSLHCNDVWYSDQLPWVLSEDIRDKCWFSVVQSSSGVRPGDVLRELNRFEKE